MRAVTYYEPSDTERGLLKDYYLPLRHLCTNTENAERVARLIEGNTLHYSQEQMNMVAMAVSNLYEVVYSQASVSHWERLGMPETKALAQMRSNEALILYGLLRSLYNTTTTAKVA